MKSKCAAQGERTQGACRGGRQWPVGRGGARTVCQAHCRTAARVAGIFHLTDSVLFHSLNCRFCRAIISERGLIGFESLPFSFSQTPRPFWGFLPFSFVPQRERAILAYKNAKISRSKVASAARADSIARTGAPAERDRRLPFGNL
jgi:hypothetical protein